MKLSRLAAAIQPSVTLALNHTAAQMKAAGEPVIHLGGGEPTSKAPPAAVEAGQQALARGEIRYGPEDGQPALKEAICDYTHQWYGRTVSPQNICVSAGTKQALMVSLLSILNPGDEAIIPAPFWASYTEMVRICGAEPIIVAPDADCQPDYDRIAAAITPRTRAILYNSPNNPSGAVYARELVEALVRLSEARGLWLLCDDIYQRLLFDGAKPLSVFDFVREDQDATQVIVLNGVSKAYAMTGFRIGWAVANPTVRKAMAGLQGQQTSGPSTLCQQAALGALRGPQDAVGALVHELERNRDALLAGLAAIPNLPCPRPGGAFYCFPDFSAYHRDSVQMAQFLLDKVKVVTVPGAPFGLEGHLRLSTCGSADAVRFGVERIRWALDPRAPREICIDGVSFVRDWDR